MVLPVFMKKHRTKLYIWAMSSPFPTWRNTERKTRHQEPFATRLCHMKPWNLNLYSPTIISIITPTLPILSTYFDLTRSLETTHTCLPHVWDLATANPTLVVIRPPCDHVSTTSWEFHPAAIAEINSINPDLRKTEHYTTRKTIKS